MAKSCLKTVLAACFFLLASVAAQAVPPLISYQGQLNDQNGVPVNGTVSFIFSIYDVESGGTALWSESQTVSVSNGIFNVQLGAVTPLDSSLFVGDVLYLGIKAGADAEMVPRQRITSSAYSQRAETLTPPDVPSGSRVLSRYFVDSPSDFTCYVIGTVPQGRKWIITSANIVHESVHSSELMQTQVALNGQYFLGILTFTNNSAADNITRNLRLSWPTDVGPVLLEGQTVEACSHSGGRVSGITVTYIEVPEDWPTKNILRFYAGRSSAGTSTIGTVPTGKTWRVVSMAIAIANHQTTNHYTYGIYLNGNCALCRGGDGSGNVFGGDFDAISFSYEQAPLLTEGQSITFTTNIGLESYGWVTVVEE